MRIFAIAGASIALLSATSALAADMLPLRNGIFVPVKSACKGASNAEMVNYWGGDSAIGVAQATCTIRKLTRKGNSYTYTDRCTDIQSGQAIEGGATTLVIASPTSFAMGGENYRYCGPKPQF